VSKVGLARWPTPRGPQDNLRQRRRVNLGLERDSRPGLELAWRDVTLHTLWPHRCLQRGGLGPLLLTGNSDDNL